MTKLAVRLVAASAAAIASAAVIAACSSGTSTNSPAASQPAASQPATPSMTMPMSSTAAGAAPAATTGSTVHVTETEFHIALGSSALKAGTYTFDVQNAGGITHALALSGPGVADKSSGSINSGQTAKLTVTLKAGKYDVFCPVGNHKMLGMDTSITVS